MPDAIAIGSVVVPLGIALFAIPVVVVLVMLLLRARPTWRRSRDRQGGTPAAVSRQAHADIPTEPITRP